MSWVSTRCFEQLGFGFCTLSTLAVKEPPVLSHQAFLSTAGSLVSLICMMFYLPALPYSRELHLIQSVESGSSTVPRCHCIAKSCLWRFEHPEACSPACPVNHLRYVKEVKQCLIPCLGNATIQQQVATVNREQATCCHFATPPSGAAFSLELDVERCSQV